MPNVPTLSWPTRAQDEALAQGPSPVLQRKEGDALALHVSHWLFLSELGKVYGPSIEQASGGEQLLPFVWAAVVNWGKTIAPLSLHGAKNAFGCS